MSVRFKECIDNDWKSPGITRIVASLYLSCSVNLI